MAFRTLVIDSHSKLEYSLNYIVFRTPDSCKKILLDEVHTVIIASTSVAVTTALLAELASRKIKVIFCDEKKNPSSELIPCVGNSNSSKRISQQISWDKNNCDYIWRLIIEQKIHNQALTLSLALKKEASEQVEAFSKEVENGDTTNREGHAAKVYFNNVFGEGFTREKDCFINACLNYGYTIILSAFNRAIVAAGYLTQLGIHHRNEFNEFNLSCDLVEPFRFLIDEKTLSLKEGDDFKSEMIGVLGSDVTIGGKTQSLTNAISIFCNSIFTALSSGDFSNIVFLKHDIGR